MHYQNRESSDHLFQLLCKPSASAKQTFLFFTSASNLGLPSPLEIVSDSTECKLFRKTVL